MVSLLVLILIQLYFYQFIDPTGANHPPKFTLNGESEILLQLREGTDTPVGTVIYTLHGEDQDADDLSFGVQGVLAAELIEIRATSPTEADIVLKRELDREIKDEYRFILTLTDGNLGDGNFITQSMIILVLDVNDNEPIFKPYNSSILIEENTLPGEITIVEATDRDEGPFGQVVYELQEPDGNSGKFDIQTVDGKGVISLINELDYEKNNIYQLQVLAKDRPSFGRRNTGTAAILVKVVDIPDQPPQFIHVPSVTRIPENIPQGALVLEVQAVDGDRGVNNKISYSLQEVEGPTGLFVIHPNTGQVFAQGILDREAEGFVDGYILQIEAQEVNSTIYPAPTASTEVTVILTDINDETPTFRNNSYIGEIMENAQVNIPVRFTKGIPDVFDYDQGKNGTFRLFLEGDDGVFDVTPHEGINEVTFLIRVKNSTMLDYEQIKKMEFKIIAEEVVKVGAKSSSANITVYIQDSNDNSPQFSRKEYIVSLPENAPLGTTVARIQAEDPDSGSLGTTGIRYTEISGQIADRLNLDPITGVVSVQTSQHGFDREQVSQYFLSVEARDDNGNGNRNTVQLIVHIEDVNDNSPQFVAEKYEARLYENELDFVAPLVVQAIDKDLNNTANSNVTYAIIGISPLINVSINPLNGEIQLESPVDFEELDGNGELRTVNVTVRASDQGVPSLHTDVTVWIYVMDVNDNAPRFESPLYSASIPEDLPSGKVILKVHAVDADRSPAFGNIVYRITSGATDKFVIDAQTGALTTAPGANLDPDHFTPKTNVQILHISALDGGIGKEQKSASVLVNVTITDVNNKLPEFKDPGLVHVLENEKPGTVIVNLTAVDPDSSAVLKFSLDPARCEARNEEGALVKGKNFNISNAFHLEPHTGIIRLARSLDREVTDIIKLLAIVRDIGAENLQTATTTVTIKVEDVNDNSPIFRRRMYSKAIPENSKPGTHIVTIVADDADINRTVTYNLQGSVNITSLIQLEPQTGEIKVVQKIDREQFSWVNFSVMAADNGVPPRASLVNVSVQVLDENDNNPVFGQGDANFSVAEDADPGTKVGVVQATDADAGDYGKITYLLDRKTSTGKFTIDPNLGVLVVADKLDRETKDSYNLIVEAWDNYQYGFNNRESRNAFKQIFIKVLDVNDEIPRIIPNEGCVSVTEYHNVHDIITTVRGIDNDDRNTPNSQMGFTIVDGDPNALFRIKNLDGNSAGIFASKQLRQHVGNFTLKIKVTDKGLPPMYSTEMIHVCVTDFNDHAPRFVRPTQNFTVKIAEDAPIWTKVVQVEAVDEDSGPNGIVRYRIKEDSFGHWRAFQIDPTNGTILLATQLDREKQKQYHIRVEGYDLGIPTPLSSDLDLTVYVKNVNDVEPQFIEKQFEVHFVENALPGSESHVLVPTVDEEEYDEGENKSSVCYYIVAGNEVGFFTLDKFSHTLSTAQPLDREEQDKYILIVYASEDCFHNPSIEHLKERSSLEVLVNIDDVNDNAPHFARRIFTGGVTTEAQFGTLVLQLLAVDFDVGQNAVLSYYITGSIHQSFTEGLEEEISHHPFLLNRTSGELKLNFDPQKGMKGYFDFNVLVNDTGGLQDTAAVYIYLLRADQRVKFVVRLTPEELRGKIDYFRDVLGNITNAIVNVDTYKYHSLTDGSVDKRKSDLYAHFVRRTDNTIMEADSVLSMIDENNDFLIALYQDLNVIESRPAEHDGYLLDSEDLVRAWLIGLSVFLGATLILVVSICLAQRSKYERKLRAATATAFGSQDSGLNRMDLPNTNQHSVEGSNPIWLQSYTNDWYKDEDSLSGHSDGTNSLDENTLNKSQHNCSNKEKSARNGHVTKRHGNDDHDVNEDDDPVHVQEQNDLNRTMLRRNIYECVIDNKLSHGPLVISKLETTEL